MGNLTGKRVIVTRAADRSSALSELLRDAGATVVEIPVTATEDATDGGRAFVGAIARLDEFEWLVVTSPEGARRVVEVARRLGVDATKVKRAAVGVATADALGGADLVQIGRAHV